MRKKTIEDYVEAIYDLQQHQNRVRTTDIAKRFNVGPGSVTEVFQKLNQDGYINYKKYAGVTLTKRGQKIAVQTKEKHDTMKELLVLLGVDEKIAEQDACKMEHLLHTETMDVAMKLVETIKQCPSTPLLLTRLRNYCKSGELNECPPELYKKCRRVLHKFEDKNI